MLDHIAGRPDQRFRKYQVFTVIFLWSAYLYKGNKHGPPGVRKVSAYFTNRLSAWQTVVLTFIYIYFTRNFASVVGLGSPEPLANMYTRDYFRATWITTALDAGFWSTMNLRPMWLRDMASMAASVYYLFAADQADEYCRKVLGCINIDYMRVSWNKTRTPYLKFLTGVMRPRFMRHPPRRIVIQRPPWSEYTEPIAAWLYFDGPIEGLKRHDKIILDVPGGGFVAMDPRCHDDKLMEWAGKSGLPVVALNYKKAPEHPFPYALNECYDAYCELVRTKGCCVGLSGEVTPKIVVSGDSAGGNLACGLILMCLQNSPTTIYEAEYRDDRLEVPVPEGLVLIYPALDMNMSGWMTPQQISLLRQKRKTNQGILSRKSEDYRKLQPRTPFGSDLFDRGSRSPSPPDQRSSVSLRRKSITILHEEDPQAAELQAMLDEKNFGAATIGAAGPLEAKRSFRTSLAMSSIISYLHDRVLSPELMRAMLLLYVGEQNQPDFATDFLLSPLLAPDALLAHFPKVYMLTGERDPLSDDTVLFAGRLRQAHEQRFLQRQELGLEPSDAIFDATEYVQYSMIPGISHGFLQFVNIYPAGWKYVEQCRRWMMEIFQHADERRTRASDPMPSAPTDATMLEYKRKSRHQRNQSESAIDDGLDVPLEMTPRHNRRSSSGQSGGGSRPRYADKDRVRKANNIYHSGRRSPTLNKKALSRLSSTENLLDRRMNGLTMNLMGDGRSTPLPDDG